MAILGFEIEEIARLLALLEAQQWEELVLQEEDRYLRIRGPRPAKPKAVAPAPEPPVSHPQPASRKALPAARSATPGRNGEDVAALAGDQIALTAPMVGVFYRADAPAAPPLVQVGDHVSVGQTIGIIEAMKIFSEIPAEHAGIVVAVPAKDGQLVQAGAPLMILRRV